MMKSEYEKRIEDMVEMIDQPLITEETAPDDRRELETMREMINRLREAGLDAWDSVDDPEAMIRHLRSE